MFNHIYFGELDRISIEYITNLFSFLVHCFLSIFMSSDIYSLDFGKLET